MLQEEPKEATRELSVAPGSRVVFLDGLRGLAALMVVVYHFWCAAQSPRWDVSLGPRRSIDLLSPLDAMGGSRVSLFFVLSGFLLYLPFARRNLRRAAVTHLERLLPWLGRRFRRLAPAYYGAMAFALLPTVGTFYLNEVWRVGLHHLPPRVPEFGDMLKSFPECLFFMHGLIPGKAVPAFNTALWTLTPEVQLYLSFPLLVALTRVRGRLCGRAVGGVGMVVMLAVLASIAYRVWLYRQIGFAAASAPTSEIGSAYQCLANTFLGRWAEFALGMGAAELVTQGKIPSARVAVLVCLVDLAALAWFLILRSDRAVCGWIGWLFVANDSAPSPLSDAMGGVTFALLIVCCASIPRIGQLFTGRPLVWLGTIAYSLYLIHLPTLLCLERVSLYLLHYDVAAMAKQGGGLTLFLLSLLLILPLILLLARLFWFYLERPFLSQTRRVTIGAQTPPS